uniref:Uncharacterized protein n=1 Tax=virus sp. ctkyY8 TaxID=2827995 RepID=A0A8S5RES3_9VIRU|nr:MAG TPA: hypothetical protein [virus sp. ctkyY8]
MNFCYISIASLIITYDFTGFVECNNTVIIEISSN